MDRDRKIANVRQFLGREKRKKGDELVFLCPICKHHKPKLGVDFKIDKFYCFVCGFQGKTLIPLFPKGPDRDEYVAGWRGPVEKEKKRSDVRLPAEFRTLSKEWNSPYYRAAVDYLRGRGIHREEILKWKLGYCEEGKYKNRVVIPSSDDRGRLNFFVGRSFYGDAFLKYLHEDYDKDIVFNDYSVDWDRDVVLTEGPFDAMSAGSNAVPIQGSLLAEDTRLFTKVVLSGVTPYLALDQDAQEKQLRIAESFVSYGVSCRWVDLGGAKDVNEMGHEMFMHAKQSASLLETSADLLRVRAAL
jgi:DNA primase